MYMTIEPDDAAALGQRSNFSSNTDLIRAGGTVEYGAGGLPAHYEALCIHILGLPASQHLLDAMFDGRSPVQG
jgi:hypothetical protein